MKRNMIADEDRHVIVDEAATISAKPQSPDASSVVEETPGKTPALDSIVDRIRQDATHDAVKYLLRSDVSHDGE